MDRSSLRMNTEPIPPNRIVIPSRPSAVTTTRHTEFKTGENNLLPVLSSNTAKRSWSTPSKSLENDVYQPNKETFARPRRAELIAATRRPEAVGADHLLASETEQFAPVAPSRKLHTTPSPPPKSQLRVARPTRAFVQEHDEFCATLGTNVELHLRSREMERKLDKTQLSLEFASKQLKVAERRAESRDEKLHALLKEKLNWQKELQATRVQIVDEKLRQVDLCRQVESAKRDFTADICALAQELRAVTDENAQIRAHSAEMRAQLNLQARKMDEIIRQAQDEKAQFVAKMNDTKQRFRDWKEGEAASLQRTHDEAIRRLKTAYELQLERQQDEKQKLREKVNELEVSMRLLQKDRTLSPLELNLRKTAILGKERAGIVEAERIETQAQILELQKLLHHSQKYQIRQEKLLRFSEVTISRLMQEREVKALANLSLYPFGEKRVLLSEELTDETQLRGRIREERVELRKELAETKAKTEQLTEIEAKSSDLASLYSEIAVEEPTYVLEDEVRPDSKAFALEECTEHVLADAASKEHQELSVKDNTDLPLKSEVERKDQQERNEISASEEEFKGEKTDMNDLINSSSNVTETQEIIAKTPDYLDNIGFIVNASEEKTQIAINDEELSSNTYCLIDHLEHNAIIAQETELEEKKETQLLPNPVEEAEAHFLNNIVDKDRSNEVSLGSSSESLESIVAEAFVALVECTAVSLVSSHRKSIVCISLENRREVIASTVVEDTVLNSTELMDSTYNAPSAESDDWSTITAINCEDSMNCEQVTDNNIVIHTDEPVNDSTTDIMGENTLRGELSVSECTEDAVIVTVMEEFAIDCEVQVDDLSTKLIEDASVAAVEDNTPQIFSISPETTDTEYIAEAEANVERSDKDSLKTARENEIESSGNLAAQNLRIESPVDTFIMARDFVEAVESEALSAVLVLLEDSDCLETFQVESGDEHEEESRSTCSIIENCNILSEEQNGYNAIASEVEDVIEILTLEVIEDNNKVDGIDTFDAVEEIQQAESELETGKSTSNDKLAEIASFEEILQIVNACTEAVEKEMLANLSSNTSSDSFNNKGEVKSRDIEEVIEIEFTSPEIISNVACHFASEVIAQMLAQRFEPCSFHEEETIEQTNEVGEENQNLLYETPVVNGDAFKVESKALEVSEFKVLEVDAIFIGSVEINSENANFMELTVAESSESLDTIGTNKHSDDNEPCLTEKLNLEQNVAAATAPDVHKENIDKAVEQLLTELAVKTEELASFSLENDDDLLTDEEPPNTEECKSDSARDAVVSVPDSIFSPETQVLSESFIPDVLDADNSIPTINSEVIECIEAILSQVETVDSVLKSIVDRILHQTELQVVSCQINELPTVEMKEKYIEYTTEAFKAQELSDEATKLATSNTQVSFEKDPLDTVEDVDKQSDFMPNSLDEVRLTVESLVDTIAVDNDTSNTSLDVVNELSSSLDNKNPVKGRSRSVHFALTEQSNRQDQVRHSVLLWETPVDPTCTKKTVENSAKRRASRRRTSRRTFADLLAFPTEMARFTTSDTTLLAYDARHEQGQQPCSLLDYSILNINPDGRHIHLDEQDERVASKVFGKRKTLMQELHSKHLALRLIPRFNYLPMSIQFQWSDFVVANSVPRSSTTSFGEGYISKSPVEPLRLLQKKGAKLPCGTYVIVCAFIRPLEDGNENLRVQIYDAERVEEFQFDFSEDMMKKYHLESTGMEAQSLEFLGHLEFRRDEDTIIIKLPEKKAGEGAKTERDRIQSERTMFGGGEPKKREHPKHSKTRVYHHISPASLQVKDPSACLSSDSTLPVSKESPSEEM